MSVMEAGSRVVRGVLGKVRKYSVRAFYSTPLHPLTKILIHRRFSSKGSHGNDLSLNYSFCPTSEMLRVSDAKNTLFFYEASRAARYFTGVDGILSVLQDRYFPENILVAEIAGATVIDVGANVGEFSLLCHKLGAAQILAFEPDPKAYKCLSKNLQQISQEASSFNIVLHEEEKDIVFYHAPNTADSSFIQPSKFDHCEQVRAYSLGQFRNQTKSDHLLIKIEAEGGEPEVLRGAHDLIKGGRVYLTIRASSERRGESTMPACRKILEEFGCDYFVAKDGKQLVAWSPDLQAPTRIGTNQ